MTIGFTEPWKPGKLKEKLPMEENGTGKEKSNTLNKMDNYKEP